MISIFDYMNYRDYLRDAFAEKKRSCAFYSYRLFSHKAGLASPNFLKLVIDGKRNLSKQSVLKFSQALGLTKKELDYFENLTFFNQAKSLDEKNNYLPTLLAFRKRNDPKKIESSEYAYYTAWYHPVIRELVTSADFNHDFSQLSRMLAPAISTSDAQKSVELLCKLGFIKKTSNNRYVKTDISISTGHTVQSVAVATYHKTMMRLAEESIERFRAADRNIESLTLSVSEKTYHAIIEKSRQFMDEMLTFTESQNETERVVQMNIQLFPLSTRFARDAA